MKTLLKITCIILALLLVGNRLNAQSSSEQEVYLGLGFGFDYGGFGGKIEYLPTRHVGLFAGLGYNLLSAGWNIGGTYKIMPDKKVSPNLMVFYGYNAVFKVADDPSSDYNVTSYGVTFGLNLDIRVGVKGNKMSIGLFVPIRSSKFKDTYDDAKADPNLKIENELIPIGFSVGYNFLL